MRIDKRGLSKPRAVFLPTTFDLSAKVGRIRSLDIPISPGTAGQRPSLAGRKASYCEGTYRLGNDPGEVQAQAGGAQGATLAALGSLPGLAAKRPPLSQRQPCIGQRLFCLVPSDFF